MKQKPSKKLASLLKIRLITRMNWGKVIEDQLPSASGLLGFIEVQRKCVQEWEASLPGSFALLLVKKEFLLCVQVDWFFSPSSQSALYLQCREPLFIAFQIFMQQKFSLKVYVRVIS